MAIIWCSCSIAKPHHPTFGDACELTRLCVRCDHCIVGDSDLEVFTITAAYWNIKLYSPAFGYS